MKSNKMTINKLSILSFLILFSIPSYAKVLSWSVNDVPSLKLTDMVGVKNSNNAIMVDSSYSTNLIRIDDIVLEEGNRFKTLFVRFSKKRFTSFVRVRIFDVFTEKELDSIDFPEQQIHSLIGEQSFYNRIYLVVELHGEDIELRSVGMEMQPHSIMTEESLKLNSETIYVSKDHLQVTITLQEEAKVNLLIYDRNGNISKTFLENKILGRGTYNFYLDPRDFSYDYAGDKRYYVWFLAENLRSKPVEFIKRFDIIP